MVDLLAALLSAVELALLTCTVGRKQREIKKNELEIKLKVHKCSHMKHVANGIGYT